MPAGTADPPSQALAIATLIAWALTASVGAFMLRNVIAAGGWRRQRSRRDGLPPGVLLGHFSLALAGLAVWASYVASGWVALAWSALGLLIPAIGLGLSTVVLWTPYPDLDSAPGTGPATASHAARFHGDLLSPPAEDALARKLTDETLASAITDDVLMAKLVENVVDSVRADPTWAARRPRGRTAALIPAGHGIGALVTFLLAVITTVTGS